ncbi:hypothetical protein TWF730_007434 [Orbilia blumenaviensis]|uniref:Uncharacterized protein n=1 Tax=Orbilia blumenaviensis TaxID=1796055 RepID=A0AAV9VAI0_9PEZI
MNITSPPVFGSSDASARTVLPTSTPTDSSTTIPLSVIVTSTQSISSRLEGQDAREVEPLTGSRTGPTAPTAWWSKLPSLVTKAASGLFLIITKAISLNIANFIRAHFGKPRTREEKPKVAINGRLLIVCLRVFLAHILPTLVTVTIIVLNAGNYYVGGNLTGSRSSETDTLFSNFLQVAAKGQELLILASLSTMVADYVRYHACGGGVPFGALTAQFSFTTLTFIFSPEFWSLGWAFPSKPPRFSCARFKHGLLLLLLFVITLAGAFIGPATAVTIIPTIGWFGGGGTHFYVGVPPGTSNVTLPSTLNSSHIPDVCLRDATSRMYDFRCPAAGFNSINNWAKTLVDRAPTQDKYGTYLRNRNPKIINTDFMHEIHFGNFEYSEFESLLFCGQPKLRDLAEWRQVKNDWSNSARQLSSRYKYLYMQRYHADARFKFKSDSPRTFVRCTTGIATKDTRHLNFTIPSLTLKLAPKHQNELKINITQGGPIVNEWAKWAGATLKGGAEFEDAKWRVQWIPAQSTNYSDITSASARVVIYSPTFTLHPDENPEYYDELGNATARYTHACSILSHWVPTTVFIDENIESDMGLLSTVLEERIKQEEPKRKNLQFYDAEGRNYSIRGVIAQDPILLQEDWLNFLTPNLIAPSDNETRGRELTLEKALNDGDRAKAIGYESNRPTLRYGNPGNFEIPSAVPLERLICSTVNDGLSRIHMNAFTVMREFEPAEISSYSIKFIRGEDIFKRPRVTLQDKIPIDSYEVKLDIEVQGYGYKRDSKTTKWALALLCGHLLLVAAHTWWAIRVKHSFRAWDTFSEFMALAVNSDRTDVLENCCAGINRFSTMRAPVRICEVDNNQIKLVFVANANSTTTQKPSGKILADTKYPRNPRF